LAVTDANYFHPYALSLLTGRLIREFFVFTQTISRFNRSGAFAPSWLVVTVIRRFFFLDKRVYVSLLSLSE
jgi:hypothetical protein